MSYLNVKNFYVIRFVDGKNNEKRDMTEKKNQEQSLKFHFRERCVTR